MAYTAQFDFLLYNKLTMTMRYITIANQIIRDELCERKVYQWEFA